MSDRTPLIVGNWKMHANHLEAIQMVQKLSYRLDAEDYDRVEVVVAPPFTALRSVQVVIDQDRMRFALSAQDCHWDDKAEITGAVSASMLAKLAVRYVIVGHSERRQQFGETDEIVNKKIRAVLGSEMHPIVCVGETLEQRETGDAESVVINQVKGALSRLDVHSVGQVSIAYEPVWAIGTGQTALPEDAGSMTSVIRETVGEISTPDTSDKVRVLYGGSVNPGNIKELMAKAHIDGALVGGASLDPDQFAAVVRYWI